MNLEKRFWSKVDIKGEDDCWNWKAAILNTGYGQIRINNRGVLAHRVAYQLFYGNFSDELLMCHKCDNRACCNPKHLFLGTIQDNNRDMLEKGRNAKGIKMGSNKLSEKEIKEIRNSPNSQTRLAIEYGVNQSTIQRIKSFIYWKHIS